jgi:hypothetical protein
LSARASAAVARSSRRSRATVAAAELTAGAAGSIVRAHVIGGAMSVARSIRSLGLSFTLAVLAAGSARAATQVLPPSDDTFINDGNADNNNGATLSIFTGTDGHGGNMRGLIRFAMPASLQGRVTVTGAQLTLTVQALGNGTAGAAATETLQAVVEAWVQGNGIGDAPSAFTVGEPCGGPVSGTTWNQRDCVAGTPWTTPGATVVAAASGQASTAGVPVGGQVTWSSASNARMNADVQAWIDGPASNHGWRITSSTEGATAEAQRFFSSEAASSRPTLAVTYSCRPGFVASGNDCVVAAPVPAAGPGAMALFVLALCGVWFVASRRAARRMTSGF